ncbi:hypothetical protein LAZ67_2005727 [Cordylochernes scorpioides]|uniref:DDE-1 domain-containing protein n=1 Tax=Cordylochernes scorpioides TaxID=51811 RepID=A0ABY6K4L0_9ARAC|nr:hypothetical protein LAZ67_2005727 [Cordylochernes scorpioides]
MARNLNDQIKEKSSCFEAFSIACDESTDIGGIAQLAIFFRACDTDFNIFEELLELVPMHGTTTGEDIFNCVYDLLQKYNLPQSKLTSVATDGAPSMTGNTNGFVALLRKKLSEISDGSNIHHMHCIIHQEVLCTKRQFSLFLTELESEYSGLSYYTEVRWLSCSKVLKQFWDLKEEICQFLITKNQDITLFSDQVWLQDFSFMVDITKHLSDLNLKLQGKDQIITNMCDQVNAFKYFLNPKFLELFPAVQNLEIDEATDMKEIAPKEFLGRSRVIRLVDYKHKRITVLVCCNMDGSEKLPLLYIGKYRRPRCFHGMNIPSNYHFNKKAWMTGAIFRDWLKKLDQIFKRRERKFLLILDDCPAHQIPEGLKNIEIRFLPALTTSALQPCDMGIIKALKDQYRKRMITYLLTCMEEKKNAQVHLLFAISWLEAAWVGVSSSTIKKCFSHSGFVMDEAMEEVVEEEMNRCFEALKKHQAIDVNNIDFLEVDKDVQVAGEQSIEEIVKEVMGKEEDEEVEPTEKYLNKTSITPAAAVDAFNTIKTLCYLKEERHACLLKKDYLEYILNRISEKKQTSIKYFFF